MRLIDADATLLKMWNALYKLEDKIEQKNGLQPIRRLDVQAGFEAGQYEVANAPTIDAVPVVRCKDCVLSEKVENNRTLCRLIGMKVDSNGYCECGQKNVN